MIGRQECFTSRNPAPVGPGSCLGSTTLVSARPQGEVPSRDRGFTHLPGPSQVPRRDRGPRRSEARCRLPSCPHLSSPLVSQDWVCDQRVHGGPPSRSPQPLSSESVISELGLEMDSVTLAGTSSQFSFSPYPEREKLTKPYYGIEIH